MKFSIDWKILRGGVTVWEKEGQIMIAKVIQF